MLSTWLRIAWHSLRKHSFYSLLNVFGLSLGVASCLILFQFISYHLRTDAYHKKAARLYRVVTDINLADGSVNSDRGAPMIMADAIRTELPQIKDEAILFSGYRDHVFTIAIPRSGMSSDKLFDERGNVAFADRHWFALFDYEWEAGDRNTALEQPNTAVLTRRQAEKYFGKNDPIGRTIRVDEGVAVRVTGVLKDYPANTDTKAELFLSLSTTKSLFPAVHQESRTEWGWISSATSLYLLLPEGMSAGAIDDQLKALKNRHLGDVAKYYDFHVLALKDAHFDERYGGTISRSLLKTLGMIGLFILLIACVNFINMATARNAQRAREISTRRILGCTPAGIFREFMTETALITFLAMLLALGWTRLALPILNQWLSTGLQLSLFGDPQLITALFSLIVFITLAAGVYPAYLLSRFKPVEVLKSRSGAANRPWLRKTLMLLQNLVAQSLIICTLIITLQTHYLKTVDPGFNKQAVLMIPLPGTDKSNLPYLRDRLLSRSDIKDVSYCFRSPATDYEKSGTIRYDHRNWESYAVQTVLGDAHYIGAFGLQLIAGRNLAESDTVRELLVSEELVKKLGFLKPDEVLGHQLVVGDLSDHEGTIVGVVKDFHLHSLHNATEPILITTLRSIYANAGIKISGTDPTASIAAIRQIWQSVYPKNVFEYHFLDDQLAALYKKEDLLNKLVGSSALLAIAISCMGLLGLISLLTVQRTREIGIRKTIGASVRDILLLLSKDLIQLVGLALILSSAIAWLTMNKWLQGFPYRITLSWWIFVLAGIANLALAMLAVCYHSIKAALVNPVISLRRD
jgi:putative ABC transport system permease protein